MYQVPGVRTYMPSWYSVPNSGLRVSEYNPRPSTFRYVPLSDGAVLSVTATVFTTTPFAYTVVVLLPVLAE